MGKLLFHDRDVIGSVAYVDTNSVLVEVEDNEKLSLLNIGSIVAIQTTRTFEFTIGIIDKVRRKANAILPLESLEGESEDVLEGDFSYISSDIIQVSLIGTYKTVDGVLRNSFRRGIDTFPQITHCCYSINGDNLKLFMNIISDEIPSEKQLVVGTFAIDNNATAILDGDKFFQRHASILGSTGSGKSWCVANLIEEASKLNNPNIIVLDMHGEYKSLCSTDKKYADYYKIAGPGDLENDDETYIFLPYWLLNRDEMLSMILDRSDNNAPNQASRFTFHVRTLKEETLKALEKSKVLSTFTVDSPIPFDITSLIDKLKEDDTKKGVGANGREVKGEWEGKLTRFISRLETKIMDKRYGFLFQPNSKTSDYKWLSTLLCRLIGADNDKKGIKIIDFSEVPSDVLPIVTGIISRLLFDVQIWMKDEKRIPFAVLCDVSKTILSQCNNFLALRLSNDRDKSVIRNLLPDALKGVLEQLPLLDVGEAIAVGDAILLPSRIRLKQPELKPISSTKNFWIEWENKKADNNAIIEAVENMRCQTKEQVID